MTGVDGREWAGSAGVPASQRPACDVAPPDHRPSSTWWDQVVLPVSRYGRFPGDPAGTGAARPGSRPGVDPAVGVDIDVSCPPPAVRR